MVPHVHHVENDPPQPPPAPRVDTPLDHQFTVIDHVLEISVLYLIITDPPPPPPPPSEAEAQFAFITLGALKVNVQPTSIIISPPPLAPEAAPAPLAPDHPPPQQYPAKYPPFVPRPAHPSRVPLHITQKFVTF